VIYFLAAGNQNARSGCQGVTLFTWEQEEIMKRGGVMDYPDLASNKITHHHEKKCNMKTKRYIRLENCT
jgi:hypothetical protein